MGTVVPFPRLVVRQFTPQMRRTLSLHAAAAPGASPVVFGTDGDGAEFCCLANGLTISWDRRGRLLLTDTASGFVDRGPFQGVDEICLVLAYLAA